ncbi:chaperone protein dnak [hydrocarbon metagenome]|uniref:Chaperone protein dnak n=1 Tax=hydrocarbon metagenome TaxID=938273 RepID=A0A0W8FYW2_9ZZZZ
MSEEIILGIDLGTTFSAVAFINKHGKPEIIPPREDSLTRTTPSVIFFDEEGNPIVGEEARNQALINPRRTVRWVKREMGNPSFRFNVDGKDYFPEDLSALILKKLKNDAEAFLGKEICKAVISVPAYFKDDQREKTRTAGQIAGLDVIRIINEPTAAALAYGLDKAQDDQTILVYDFGGGTFDVTIMTAKGKEFKIIATDGDAKLGGKDIDALLVEYFAEQFQREHEIDLRVEPHTHQDLWDKAEKTKKDLSFRNNVAVALASGEKTLRVDIDVEFFNELIEDLIKQTEECMNQVIQDSNMNWEQIDTILLAGGSSRIPAVRDMIKRVTGKEVTRDMNPDECVAMGAAIQANIISRETGETAPILEGGADLVVYDVASHGLGVKALSSDKKKYINSIIIPRFTPIPCEKTRTYATNEDNQSRVEIEVLQGENVDPNSPEVQLIGKAGLKNLPPHKAGDLVIEITLQYNADGVIEVIAKELKSGEKTREIIMQKTGTLSSEIIEEKRETLSQFDV